MICTYDELKKSLSIGEEFDFYIGEFRYGISKGKYNNWCLAKYGTEDYQYFDDYIQLLQQAMIEGAPLKEVNKTILINDVTVMGMQDVKFKELSKTLNEELEFTEFKKNTAIQRSQPILLLDKIND